jgi:hypothetical protein
MHKQAPAKAFSFKISFFGFEKFNLSSRDLIKREWRLTEEVHSDRQTTVIIFKFLKKLFLRVCSTDQKLSRLRLMGRFKANWFFWGVRKERKRLLQLQKISSPNKENDSDDLKMFCQGSKNAPNLNVFVHYTF